MQKKKKKKQSGTREMFPPTTQLHYKTLSKNCYILVLATRILSPHHYFHPYTPFVVLFPLKGHQPA